MKTHIEVVMSASARPVKRQLTQKLCFQRSVQSVDTDPFTDIKEREEEEKWLSVSVD